MTQHEYDPALPLIDAKVHYTLLPRGGEITSQNDGSRAPLGESAKSISVIGRVVAVNEWKAGGGAVVIQPERTGANTTPRVIVVGSPVVADSAVRQPFINTDLLR